MKERKEEKKKEKKTYEKPRIVYQQPLEASATVCSKLVAEPGCAEGPEGERDT